MPGPAFDLRGRVALVVGGTGRLGLPISQALRSAGASVAVGGRSRVRCEESAQRIGGGSMPVALDVTQPAQVADAVRRVVRRFGGLDILVNAAGIAKPVSVTAGSLQDWHDVLAVNLTGAFLCARAAAAVMMRRRRGKIINVASIYGALGVDKRLYGARARQTGTLAYTASKGGVINFTRDLAVDLGPYNVQVNAVSPGAVRSRQDPAFLARYRERTPMRRLAEGADLQGAVIFLASAASDYMTGQNLIVDGGFSAW